MKTFMRVIIVAFVMSVIIAMVPFEASCSKLQNDVFRLHILADSNSEQAQNLKLKVRDQVLSYASKRYENVSTKADAMKITQDELSAIKAVAQNTVRENGYNYNVTAEIKKLYFNTRYYKNFTMPAGMYDALEIKIGSGKGNNWWCVMYPSLCVGASSEQSMKDDLSEDEYSVVASDDFVFRFKIVEYYEKIVSFFR